MAADHEMRPECSREFGKISTALEFHKGWRDEQLSKLNKLQSEIEKLTGNGNRGKIDELASSLASVERMMTDHLARSEASQQRISSLEQRVDVLDSRVFSTSVKVAGAVGLLVLIGQYLWKVLF